MVKNLEELHPQEKEQLKELCHTAKSILNASNSEAPDWFHLLAKYPFPFIKKWKSFLAYRDACIALHKMDYEALVYNQISSEPFCTTMVQHMIDGTRPLIFSEPNTRQCYIFEDDQNEGNALLRVTKEYGQEEFKDPFSKEAYDIAEKKCTFIPIEGRNVLINDMNLKRECFELEFFSFMGEPAFKKIDTGDKVKLICADGKEIRPQVSQALIGGLTKKGVRRKEITNSQESWKNIVTEANNTVKPFGSRFKQVDNDGTYMVTDKESYLIFS